MVVCERSAINVEPFDHEVRPRPAAAERQAREDRPRSDPAEQGRAAQAAAAAQRHQAEELQRRLWPSSPAHQPRRSGAS